MPLTATAAAGTGLCARYLAARDRWPVSDDSGKTIGPLRLRIVSVLPLRARPPRIPRRPAARLCAATAADAMLGAAVPQQQPLVEDGVNVGERRPDSGTLRPLMPFAYILPRLMAEAGVRVSPLSSPRGCRDNDGFGVSLAGKVAHRREVGDRYHHRSRRRPCCSA
jgi:hypothetical protein